MFRPKNSRFFQFILCCSILLLVAGCGLSEMFGGSNAEKITEPCLDSIPTTTPIPTLTPTPSQTVIPIATVTPLPGKTPTPSQSCGNAPGIVLICDGEPVEETPITVITPPPVTLNYTINVSTLNSSGCTSGTPTILPPGPVVVVSGDTRTFVISPPLGCPISIYFNGTFLGSTSTGSISVTTPPVIINSNLLVYY